jgi:hypothetical protein
MHAKDKLQKKLTSLKNLWLNHYLDFYKRRKDLIGNCKTLTRGPFLAALFWRMKTIRGVTTGASFPAATKPFKNEGWTNCQKKTYSVNRKRKVQII